MREYIMGVDPGRKGAFAIVETIKGDLVGMDDAFSGDPDMPKNRACKIFCVNGHPAGNCYIARSDDDRRKESSTEGITGQPVG